MSHFITLVVGDNVYKLNLVPSGIARQGVKCFIGNGVVLDPQHLPKEIKELEELKLCPKLLKNGDTRRYSAMAHAQLLTIKQKIANDLMRYGYARIPETVNIKPEAPKGITINLTPKGHTFDPDSVVDVVSQTDEED